MSSVQPSRKRNIEQDEDDGGKRDIIDGKKQATGTLLKPLNWIGSHLNFFRIHLLAFIILPLIFAAIFYTIDISDTVDYISALTLCTSAMTVTGLNPLLMQNLNHRQHALCFILSTIGSTTGVSLIAIAIRKSFFLSSFRDRIEADRAARMQRLYGDSSKRRFSIRRLGEAVRVDNSGKPDAVREEANMSAKASPRTASPTPMDGSNDTFNTGASQTLRGEARAVIEVPSPRSTTGPLRKRTIATRGIPLHPTLTRNPTNKAMVTGLGGFQNPLKVALQQFKDRFDRRRSSQHIPPTKTILSTKTGAHLTEDAEHKANYISFDALVGRNSRFLSLTAEQRDELGGVEYRALSLLFYIVLGYILLVQLIPIAIFCPIFNSRHYSDLFENAGTITGDGALYAAFNINSAFANAGLSLLDASMVPFQETWGWSLVMSFEIIAGNVAFPIFLRLVIWSMSKIVRPNSRMHESLTFLLDHPRRCFFYLFPSYQTWFLVFMLFFISGTQWVLFPILNAGLAVFEQLDTGARAMDGLFQAVATRAAGYAIVPLGALAPSYQLVMVIVMYISVYPISLSIRASNVYEEQSLGVFHAEDEDEEEFEIEHSRLRRPGAYFLEHAKRQLAFDGWYLLLAIWLICIVERTIIIDDSTDTYLNMWTVIFETISAYGTVGLSLGVPYANYSLCGAFGTLSKLVLCAVMIRGRHRGLPVTIDRSILLPSDIASISPPTDAPGHVQDKPKSDLHEDRSNL